MRAGRTLLAGVLIAAAAAGVAAGAGRTWQPALTITPRGAEPGDPAAASAGGGQALGAFTVNVSGRAQVEARVRDDARSPWARVVLSGTFPDRPPAPAAAIESAGRAVVVWRVPGGAIRSAVRDTPPGAWRVIPVTTGGPADEFFSFRQAVAVMDGGDNSAALAWAERAGGAWTVRSARRAGPGAPWAETPPLVLGPGTSEPSVALSRDGTAVAAWTVPAGGGVFATGPLLAAVRATDGAWSGPVTLAASGALLPSAGAGADGRAAVAWEDRTTSTPTVTLIEAGLGTAWGAPQAIGHGQAPRVASNAGGDLALLWAGPGTSAATPILVATRATGGTWPAPAVLTPGVGMTWIEASLARVAVGGTGRAFAAVLDQEGPGSATVVLGAARPGEAWTIAPQPVGADEFGFALSAASGGDGLALLPTEPALLARDFDSYGRPVVSAALAGKARGDGTVAWTAVVRNRGRFAARSVTLRLGVCCGTRLLSAQPAGTRAGPQVTWRVPRLAPGRRSTIRLTLRHTTGRGTPRLSGTITAVAVPPSFVTATARR